MKDIKVVLENLSTQGIVPDDAQISFLKEFIAFDSSLKPKSFFSKKNLIDNLYLFGPVGRGKTLMLQAINECYFSHSGKFHFVEFMGKARMNHLRLRFSSALCLQKKISSKINLPSLIATLRGLTSIIMLSE